ncbi:hypothetical protein D3C80_2147290 [compost metagenome]
MVFLRAKNARSRPVKVIRALRVIVNLCECVGNEGSLSTDVSSGFSIKDCTVSASVESGLRDSFFARSASP